jgi:hypothetical protein
MPFKKNTAVTGFPFALISASDGSAITSGTVNGYYLLDGGTQGSITGTPTHEGNGQWSVDLLAAEMNGDLVGLLFTHSSAIPAHFTIKTETKLVSELQDPTAAAIRSEIDSNSTQLAAIVADTDELQTDDVPGLIAALNDPSAADIRTEIDSNSTQLAAIVADTDELQTDDVPGLIAALNDPTAAAVADAVWDEASTGHVDAGKAGAQLWTDVDAILADTDELQTDDVPGLIAALNDPSAADIRTEIDSNSTQLAAIVADTGTDGVVLANNAITAAKIATDAIGSDEIAAAGANKIADHTIRRTFQNACDSSDGDAKTGRSLLGAIAKLVNKVGIAGSTLTAYEDDDTTSLYSQAISTDSGADPIIQLDTN